jgi:hypothetical protein
MCHNYLLPNSASDILHKAILTASCLIVKVVDITYNLGSTTENNIYNKGQTNQFSLNFKNIDA